MVTYTKLPACRVASCLGHYSSTKRHPQNQGTRHPQRPQISAAETITTKPPRAAIGPPPKWPSRPSNRPEPTDLKMAVPVFLLRSLRPRAPVLARPAPRRHRTLRTMAETIPSTPIKVLRTIDAVRQWRRPQLLNYRSVGFVPTMGALHEGHVALIRAAARENHHVVISIFVNPAQFGVREDLASYPVTWDTDTAALALLDRELADDGANLGRISAVFAPTTPEMYPSGFPGQEVDSKGSFVNITPTGELLEGASRPTFFRGVATVCMKLFNIVQPERVYFGQKDVQQTVVIRRMIRDFMLPTDLVVCPTRREPDGLALSSRNVYLGPRRRAVAIVLADALRMAEELHKAGARDRATLLGAAREVAAAVMRAQAELEPDRRVVFEVDYISLSDPDTLLEVEAVDPEKGAVLSGAIKMLPVEKAADGEDLGHEGGPAVRLIDNIIFKPTTA